MNGAGAAAASKQATAVRADGSSVTVPGVVAAWALLNERWGNLSLGAVLAPAIELARGGFQLGNNVAKSVAAQRERLISGGAEKWSMVTTDLGQTIVQPVLADLLNRIGDNGTSAFYEGAIAAAISHRCREAGGFLTDEDFARHESVVTASIGVDWRGGRVLVQPPMSTGVLLAMMLQGFETQAEIPQSLLDHACIELTEAAFEFRDRVGDGTGLLGKKLDINLDRASRRGGPRSYLHTAGVAVADADGLVVSSLASVFDDFGSAIYVPEGGFVLNNRAEGFTNPPNDPAPGKRPVHTLAPALVESDHGVMALATPGADGQVQTLLQILVGLAREGLELDAVIDRPRWRSEQGRLLIDRSHEQAETLRELGHDLVLLDDGDKRFGGVVCAGRSDTGPFAVSDWRRQVCSGVI